ncbi:MAG: PH domain-containing protein [Phycisphaerales bacterium]|nr:PH domain-containing protein [Phycisphaerales bacterium]
MTEPTILRKAEFDPKVKSYWILGPVIVLSIFIITIPIAILYALIARMFIDRKLANMSCTLTEHTLDIRMGIWNKTESTIPLEKITDLQLFQGPIMRHFGIHGFKVETAGQSSPTGGALVNLIGIVDTKEFRQAVLDQRDRTNASASPVAAIAQSAIPTLNDPQTTELLTDIRDSLQRIEQNFTNNSG